MAWYNRLFSRGKPSPSSPRGRLSRRKYAAAKTSRLTGEWSPVDSTGDDIVNMSSKAVRARVRQLIRDFPYFTKAINTLVDHTVGDGIVYQSRMTDKTGSLAARANSLNEDMFYRWAEQADTSGKLHLNELMRLAKRQDVESGEFFFLKRMINDPKRFLPLAYQPIEADRLTNSGTALKPASGNVVDYGIEYNVSTGVVVAYHIDSGEWNQNIIKVPAGQMLHGYQILRPGQMRGISPFTPGVLVAHDLSEFMDASIDQAKMAGKWLAMITTPDAMGRQLNIELDDDTGDPIEELQNGIIEYLRPGEEVKFPQNPHPSDNFDSFVRLILTMLATATGVPYELISGDYRGMNYTVSRMSRNDFATSLKPLVSRHVRDFCNPILRDFFDVAVGMGVLKYDGYYQNPQNFLKSRWFSPAMGSPDPLKEAKAKISLMDELLMSPQEICAERGRDYFEVINEIAAAKAAADKLNLTPAEVSTAISSAPSAVDGQKKLKVI